MSRPATLAMRRRITRRPPGCSRSIRLRLCASGFWRSREGNNAGAEAAFARAESLYRTASNAEGLAEIDYQRGLAASLRSDLPTARAFVENRSMRRAEMQSAQLEIRALNAQ